MEQDTFVSFFPIVIISNQERLQPHLQQALRHGIITALHTSVSQAAVIPLSFISLNKTQGDIPNSSWISDQHRTAIASS